MLHRGILLLSGVLFSACGSSDDEDLWLRGTVYLNGSLTGPVSLAILVVAERVEEPTVTSESSDTRWVIVGMMYTAIPFGARLSEIPVAVRLDISATRRGTGRLTILVTALGSGHVPVERMVFASVPDGLTVETD